MDWEKGMKRANALLAVVRKGIEQKAANITVRPFCQSLSGEF